MTGGWSGGLKDLVHMAMVMVCIIRIIDSELGLELGVYVIDPLRLGTEVRLC